MILNYMGSKKRLIPVLNKVIEPLLVKAKEENNGKQIVFGDMFAGTGFVSNFYQSHECVKRIVTTDLELYSYVLTKALLTTSYNDKLARIIRHFNNNTLQPVKGLIWRYFSPAGGRMFFTEANAMRIDAMRICISRLYKTRIITYNELLFLLASLLCACSKSANAASCFRAYLKKFHPRSEKRIEITPIHQVKRIVSKDHKVYKSDTIRVASHESIDVAYLDPPYNANHYGGYYSFYNYLLVYNPTYEINGVAGVTSKYNKSKFGFKASVKASFNRLVSKLNKCKYIILSYNQDGILTKKELADILRQFGNVTIYKTMNRKYRPNINVKNLYVVDYIMVLQNGKKHGFVTEKWI
jgi:adenine-specific DNA-methyltransferase